MVKSRLGRSPGAKLSNVATLQCCQRRLQLLYIVVLTIVCCLLTGLNQPGTTTVLAELPQATKTIENILARWEWLGKRSGFS